MFRGSAPSAISAALAVYAAAAPAAAYRTGGDTAELAGTDRVRFAEGGVFLRSNGELPDGVDELAFETAVTAAVRAWAEPACSAFRFTYQGLGPEAAEPGDGINTIQWVSDWGRLGFDPTAAAATDVQYVRPSGGDWTIVEADVYLNGELGWNVGPGDPGAELRDLGAVLTHELGHALGLLHPCEPDGAGGAPDCADMPEARGSALYPLYDASQSELSDDDVAGLCFLYPLPACGEHGCALGEQCTETGCTPAAAACSHDDDCGGAELCERGRCSARPDSPCGGAEPCGDGGTAGNAGAGAGAGGACGDEASCRSSEPRLLGERCDHSRDCADGSCVAGVGDEPICTRACGEGLADCPAYWTCAAASGGHVCVPKPTVGFAEGCSLSPVRRSRGFEWWFMTSFGLGAAWARVRRLERRVKEKRR